jgi:hypothetical protein
VRTKLTYFPATVRSRRGGRRGSRRTCRRGSYRKLLLRDWIGNRVPGARQCADQRRPAAVTFDPYGGYGLAIGGGGILPGR